MYILFWSCFLFHCRSVIRPVKLTLFPQMVYGCQKEIIGHDSEPRMLITADVSTLFFRNLSEPNTTQFCLFACKLFFFIFFILEQMINIYSDPSHRRRWCARVFVILVLVELSWIRNTAGVEFVKLRDGQIDGHSSICNLLNMLGKDISNLSRRGVFTYFHTSFTTTMVNMKNVGKTCLIWYDDGGTKSLTWNGNIFLLRKNLLLVRFLAFVDRFLLHDDSKTMNCNQ